MNEDRVKSHARSTDGRTSRVRMGLIEEKVRSIGGFPEAREAHEAALTRREGAAMGDRRVRSRERALPLRDVQPANARRERPRVPGDSMPMKGEQARRKGRSRLCERRPMAAEAALASAASAKSISVFRGPVRETIARPRAARTPGRV